MPKKNESTDEMHILEQVASPGGSAVLVVYRENPRKKTDG